MAHTPHSTDPSTTTAPFSPPPDQLVWTTVGNGPSRQIIDEWVRYSRRPAILRHVNAWPFMPHRVEHLDEVLELAGFGRAIDDADGDHFLWQLVRMAEHDDIAARIVLHRMMPSIMNMARRRGPVFHGGIEAAMNDAIGTAWMIIRTFPHDRRPRKIAANLARDTENYAFVRQHRLRRVPELQVGDEKLYDIFELRYSPDKNSSFDDVMAEAQESGVRKQHIELLHRLASGEHSRDLAKEMGMSARTVRQHRKDAVEEVRRVLLNN